MDQEKQTYPVNLMGDLSIPPARGWWLIKWLLSIPHLVILVFLWVATIFVWIIAFFSILFTEKYPRSLFDFTVGVMRWTWRVCFYAFDVLGTDKYPPFTLQPAADYPADIAIDYPEKLSRGLVLIKWWLLAIPHYFIVTAFTGYYRYNVDRATDREAQVGLITILAVIAGFGLLFTGRYHEPIFKLLMGLNRWSYRVIAYAGLLTDKYPPFRLWDD